MPINSIAARSTLTALRSSLLILAVATLPCISLAQPAPPAESADTPQRYLELIAAIEEDQGANAAALIEPLEALGLLQVERGAYDLAAEGFARAIGLVRVNHGLATVQEAGLLRQQVLAVERSGDAETAWELEQRLLQMARQHAGNPATFPIFSELAAKRLAVLEQYRAGHFPPQIVLGCYYGDNRADVTLVIEDAFVNTSPEFGMRCQSGDRRTVLISLLREARAFQVLAIEALLQSDHVPGEELPQLVTDLLRTSYQLHLFMPAFSDPFLELALSRVFAYESTDSAFLQRQALLLVLLADLNVLRMPRASRPAGYEAVLEQYQKAYAQLKDAGLSQAALAAIFAPDLPVELPAYQSNPFVEEPTATVYIDVAFDINKYGRSKQVRVVATSDAVKRSERWKLLRQIRESRFRPRTTDGQFAASSAVVVRYERRGENGTAPQWQAARLLR